MADTVNWGLIGPGLIAERFARSTEHADGAVLYGVASRSEARAQSFAKAHGAVRFYSGYSELIEDESIDVIYISTPHRFHYEQIKMCLEAGKPVLCEKPLTVNAAEAQELIDLARDKGVFLMEAMWSPLLPIYSQLSEWVAQGAIGEIKHIQSSFGFSVDRDPKGRYLNHDVAGGVLLDMGVYNVALSQWLLGRSPEHVFAHGLVGETRVDEVVSATLDYGDGVISQFLCSFQSQLPNTFVVCGTLGRIVVPAFFWDTQAITLEKQDGEIITRQLPFKGAGFEYEIEHVQSCLKSGLGESSLISHALTLQTQKVMDSIRSNIGLKFDFE